MQKTTPHIVIGVLLSLLLADGIWLTARAPRGESAALHPPPTPVTIQVNVAGAVAHPGVYELGKNSRVADAVEAAGGFASEADKDGLNLAAHVENGQGLDIPYQAGFVPVSGEGDGVGSENTPRLPTSSNAVLTWVWSIRQLILISVTSTARPGNWRAPYRICRLH